METMPDRDAIRPHQAPQELAKLIRKLRWIGMEEEAHRLEAAVASIPNDERGTVAAEPFSTD